MGKEGMTSLDGLSAVFGVQAERHAFGEGLDRVLADAFLGISEAPAGKPQAGAKAPEKIVTTNNSFARSM